MDVYDLGGLRRVVDLHASVDLLQRSDQIEAWCGAAMRACRIEYADPARRDPMRLVDLTSGEGLDVLDLGAAVEPGQHVLARIVPTDAEPGLVFDWGLLPVREPVAQAVAADPQRWLPALHAQTLRGELEPGDSHLPEASLICDLPYRSWLSLVGVPLAECPDHDPRPLFAKALERVLDLAVSPKAAGHRHAIAQLLLDPLFDETMRWRFVAPEFGPAWRLLGEVVPDHARSRCEELALWCAASRARRHRLAVEMPKSRVRKPKRSRQQEKVQYAGPSREGWGESEPWIRAMMMADEAEATGDAVATLEIMDAFATGPDGEFFWRPWRAKYLGQIAMLGPILPGWVISRWICSQAMQSLAEAKRGPMRRAFDLAVELRGGESSLPGVDLPDAHSRVLDHDWVYRQLFLYEFGGLDLFMRDRAVVGPAGRGRLDPPVRAQCDGCLSARRLQSEQRHLAGSAHRGDPRCAEHRKCLPGRARRACHRPTGADRLR
jgi:hypothetical protein